MRFLVTTSQAAEILNVVPARIRQLNADGAISAQAFGPRTVLYDQREIHVYARTTRGHEQASGVAATAKPADPPLPLIVNAVVQTGSSTTADLSVHVRVWRDDHRTVVVASTVAGSSISLSGWHFRDLIMPVVSEEWLSGDLFSAYWISVDVTPSGWLDVDNHVVLGDSSARTAERRWFGRRTLRESPVETVSIDLPDGIETIDALVGRTVRHFPHQDLATAERIHALSRQDQVSVIVDPAGARPLVEAMTSMSAHEESRSEFGQVALRALHICLTDIFDAPAEARLPEWVQSGGTRAALGGIGEYNEHVDSDHCAVTATVDDVADIDWRNIIEPGQPEPTGLQLRQAWIDLNRWRDRVGQYGPVEDRAPILDTALGDAGTAIEQLYRSRRRRDPSLPQLPPRYRATANAFPVTPTLQRYWEQGTSAVADDVESNRLLDTVTTWLKHTRHGELDEVRTSTDGTAMARISEDLLGGERHSMIWVMWPLLTTEFESVPDGARIVADGAPGELPVFLRHTSGTLHALPRPTDQFTVTAWNFGPGESGAAIAHAIASIFEVGDGLRSTRTRFRIIEHAVSNSDPDALDLSVDALRASVAAIPEALDDH